MKIAIMTQPLGKNYGGIMQAWALQQVLKRMGHDPITIDRRSDAENVAYKLSRLAYRAAMKAIGRRKAPVNFERHLPYILQNTQRFIKNHITISEPLDSDSGITRHFKENKYDAVVVGSDQTWRPIYSPNIYNFYLDFIQETGIKKIAYASSFGVSDWEYTPEQSKGCALLAKKFDAISVREKSGIHLCTQHLGVESAHVLDPTLLLGADDYITLLKLSQPPQNKGIFAYILDPSNEKSECADTVCRHFEEKLFRHQPEEHIGSPHTDNISSYKLPEIEGWLESFNKSSFVVTDSFHGCVFSIIFKKPFLAIANSPRGSARFESLFEKFGLEDRLISSPSKAKETLERKINWENVHSILDEEKIKSLSFLNKSLSNAT